MCNAFSCLISREGKVTWKMGIDGHSELVNIAGLSDNTADKSKLDFARVEITPKGSPGNPDKVPGDYRRTEDNIPRTAAEPGEWTLTIDEQAKPTWWCPTHEAKCRRAHQQWLEQLYAILDTTTDIAHPFKDIAPPKRATNKRPTKQVIQLLQRWSKVADSVGYSVWDSVWNSVEAQIGSLFRLPRNAWKHTEQLPDACPVTGSAYPFQPAVDLWKMGLVPSFNGKTWRLHAGTGLGKTESQVVFEIGKDKLGKDKKR